MWLLQKYCKTCDGSACRQSTNPDIFDIKDKEVGA